MSDKHLSRLILEAALDEVSVDFIARNAFEQYGVSRADFDKVVKKIVENNNAKIDAEFIYNPVSQSYTKNAHFMPTELTISALEDL